MQKVPQLAYGSSEPSPWKNVHGLHLLHEGSPLWSALYLSALCRRQHHPSLSQLILFFPARLPIDSSVFWFAAFMFPDLCTHRPSPGFALGHSPAKTHKTNFNIACSRHIKKCCRRSETSFSILLLLSLSRCFRMGLVVVAVLYSAAAARFINVWDRKKKSSKMCMCAIVWWSWEKINVLCWKLLEADHTTTARVLSRV